MFVFCEYLSLHSCCFICCVLYEGFVRCNPHLAWSSFVQSSPAHGSRGLLAMRHPWQPGPAAVATSLGMTPDLWAGAWKTGREPQSYRHPQEGPPGGDVRQCCLAPGSGSGRIEIAKLNVPSGHAPLTTRLMNLNCLIIPLSEPQSPGWIPHWIQDVVCPCPLHSRVCFPDLQCLLCPLPRSDP